MADKRTLQTLARFKARKRRQERRKSEAQESPSEEAPPRAKGRPLNLSFEEQLRLAKEGRTAEIARQKVESPVDKVTDAKTRRLYKARTEKLGAYVSQEEKDLIKGYVKQFPGIGFSAWVRETLFEAMGQQIPPRK